MDEQELCEILTEAIMNLADKQEEEDTSALTPPSALRIRTFAEAGLLTNNEGLVITLPNGDKFQITVVAA